MTISSALCVAALDTVAITVAKYLGTPGSTPVNVKMGSPAGCTCTTWLREDPPFTLMPYVTVAARAPEDTVATLPPVTFAMTGIALPDGAVGTKVTVEMEDAPMTIRRP